MLASQLGFDEDQTQASLGQAFSSSTLVEFLA